MPTIKLYRHALSGHSHRVQLFVPVLGLGPGIIDVNLAQCAHKNEEFLQKNRFGQVPVLEDDVPLERYPNIRGWIERVDQQLPLVPMQTTAVGLAA